MHTAAEYRQYAQDCIDSARAANSEAVRAQFLELAELWLAPVLELQKGIGRDDLDGQQPTPLRNRSMSQADEYRRKAAECQQQANKSITPLDKQHWFRLAEHWLKIAEAVGDEADDELE
jgi:hypothetical protein